MMARMDLETEHDRPAPAPPRGLTARLLRPAWVRRMLSGLSLMLAVVGVGMLAYPFATNVWQGRIQDRLEGELDSDETRAAYEARTIAEGHALTRLVIPKIGIDVVVVEGTSPSALRAGAGHYPATPLPGEIGNVAIAGHRTTYGRPFHSLDNLAAGDDIILHTPIGEHTYKVVDPLPGARRVGPEPQAGFVVRPSDWTPIANTPDAFTLTLTTCHPKGSASQRLVVRAVLYSSGLPDA